VRYALDGLGDKFGGASERLIWLSSTASSTLRSETGSPPRSHSAQRTWSWPMSRPTAYAAVGCRPMVRAGRPARCNSAARLVPSSLKIPAAIKSAISEPTVARESPVRLVRSGRDSRPPSYSASRTRIRPSARRLAGELGGRSTSRGASDTR